MPLSAAQMIHPLTETEEPDDLTRRGLTFYNERLKAFLEPGHTGEAVAIHVESGDYAVAPSSGEAMRMMLKKYPGASLLLHTIGISDDPGLVSRMLGARIFPRTR